MQFAFKKRRATLATNGRASTFRASKSETKPFAAAAAYFEGKIRGNAAVTDAPDGPYTWIMKDTGEPPLLVIVGRTSTQQELGTLHQNLDVISSPGDIVAAGEFLKEGSSLLYNLQSGTYMGRLFPKRASATAKAARQRSIRTIAETRFRELGLDPTFNEAPPTATHEEIYGGQAIIDTMEILTTVSEMDELERLLSGSSS